MNLLLPERLGELPHRPIVESVFHRIREAALVVGDVVVFHVGGQVAVAGEALVYFLRRRGLHLDRGFERFLGVEVADAHLPCADDQRNFVFADHDGNVVHACGAFGQPAVGVVHRQLRIDPAVAPFGRHEVPELVQVPECIPECVAAQHDVFRGIGHGVHFAVGRNPLAVYVAPRIAAADRTVHVVVETDLFEPVVGLHSQAAEQVVPCVHLIPAYGLEIPAERFGDFGREVLRGVFDADQRDARTHLHDGMLHGIEFGEQARVFAGPADESRMSLATVSSFQLPNRRIGRSNSTTKCST